MKIPFTKTISGWVVGVVMGIVWAGMLQVAYGQEFNADSAWAQLVRQVDFGPRNPGSTGHRACKDYLVRTLKRFTADVREQSFMHYDAINHRSLMLTNIIARFQPQNPDRILLCAHWDTRPRADQEQDPTKRNQPIPGANDGASGVAVLLEIARLLSQQPVPVGVDIVLFDGEDYGREGHLDEYFLGSRYFVKHNREFYPRYAILLDMVGDKQLQLPQEGYSVRYAPDVVNRIWGLGAALGYAEFQNTVGYYVSDDHGILNEAGIPAIDIIDFFYPDQSHRYWHTLEDTPDKCSPRSLKVVGDVIWQLLQEGG